MRTHGTLTKWNDDRGFGFITPAGGHGDVFVHISAFPREGGRPQLNELISFEIEPGQDGKKRAVRVMRPGQKERRTSVPRAKPSQSNRMLGRALTVLAIAGLGAYVYSTITKQTTEVDSPLESSPMPPSSNYRCDGRNMCSQMKSCEEATYFLRNCPGPEMDGDGDGIPCESQWCN